MKHVPTLITVMLLAPLAALHVVRLRKLRIELRALGGRFL
jgi:hypothetical protein